MSLLLRTEDQLISHVVQIQTQIRDPVAIRAACDRLHLPEPVFGEVQLFNRSATGWAVQLPEWKYPIVCDVTSANIAYDNYNGRWGDPVHLSRFQQMYAVEKAKIESRLRGHTCLEQTLTDGSIKLTINVGGAA